MSAKKAVERKDSAALRRARDLRGHESTIENARKSFIDMGRALGRIRADGLYEDGYDSFEAYLEERWDITPRHAYRLIEAARVALILRPIGPEINSEAVARELAPMTEDTDRMVEVYAEAERRAAGGRVTAALVREVRDQLYPGVIEGEYTDDETPPKSPVVDALRQAIEEVETSAGGEPADEADPVGAGNPEHSAGAGDGTSPVAVPTQNSPNGAERPVPAGHHEGTASAYSDAAAQPPEGEAGDEAAEDPSVSPFSGSSAADPEAPAAPPVAMQPDDPDAGSNLSGEGASSPDNPFTEWVDDLVDVVGSALDAEDGEGADEDVRVRLRQAVADLNAHLIDLEIIWSTDRLPTPGGAAA